MKRFLFFILLTGLAFLTWMVASYVDEYLNPYRKIEICRCDAGRNG